MPPQGVMSLKQANYSPGLNPIKGQEFCPGTQTRSRDKLSSLSLGITKTLPLSPVLVDQPATEPVLQISPGDTQGRLRSKKLYVLSVTVGYKAIVCTLVVDCRCSNTNNEQ